MDSEVVVQAIIDCTLGGIGLIILRDIEKILKELPNKSLECIFETVWSKYDAAVC